MGVHSPFNGCFFASLLNSSFEETFLSLDFEPDSYMYQLPLVLCLSPSSIGVDPDWLVASSSTEDMETH